MKASIEWLKEFSDIDVSAEELVDILTMSGTKVETLDRLGNDIKNVVVGQIQSIEPHPNADKLVITKVDVGDKKIQIVTGAKNIKEGDVIPVCLDGSSLPGGKKITAGKLRGEDSCGMLASIGELNLTLSDYPEQIEDGIMILPKEYAKYIGKDIVDVLKLREDIIDFEITPNRVDCLGVEGIGREVAVSLDTEFKNPNKKLDNLNVKKVDNIDGLTVEIKDETLCSRYIARVVKNLRIKQSPEWLRRRLKALGVRAINNVVDITNYVMLEMGQPLHAFDFDKIRDKKLIVRSAKKDENFRTLDKVDRILDEEDIVISDGQGPVALAGIMGGENSEITEDTKTLVFEAATFKRGAIRKTSKRQNLRSESSNRFEKGLSSENALRAINRACDLIEILDAGDVEDCLIDIYPVKQEESVVKLDVNRINTLCGAKFEEQYVLDILKHLEFEISKKGKDIYVKAPYFRLDIESNADLAEEVLRFYGYNNLENTLCDSKTTVGLRNKEQNLHTIIEKYLMLNGFSEIYTYGFLGEKDLEKANIDKEMLKNKIVISNPLSEDYKLMRPTTLPAMLQTLKTNQNKDNENVKLFDISRIYLDNDKQIEKNEVPKEEKIITLGIYGNYDFYYLKGIVENLLDLINVSNYKFRKEEKNNSYHTGRCANIEIGKDVIATLGEIHPKVINNYDFKEKPYLAQINLSKLVKYSRDSKKYVEVPKYPAVTRDISLVVDEDIQVDDIKDLITKVSKKYLEDIQLFDIFRSSKIGENKKSLAFNLKFRDKNKTLNNDEVNDLMSKITDQLKEKLNANLR